MLQNAKVHSQQEYNKIKTMKPLNTLTEAQYILNDFAKHRLTFCSVLCSMGNCHYKT